jgi:hypothetical protein
MATRNQQARLNPSLAKGLADLEPSLDDLATGHTTGDDCRQEPLDRVRAKRQFRQALALGRRRLTSSMERLREEILNSQTVRSDLLKYKLVIAGALGAAGLGLAGSNATGHSDLVLCTVPLACLYVDLLCRHLSLRILVIGTFYRKKGSATASSEEFRQLADYEKYVGGVRDLGRNLPIPWKKDVFGLEDAVVT